MSTACGGGGTWWVQRQEDGHMGNSIHRADGVEDLDAFTISRFPGLFQGALGIGQLGAVPDRHGQRLRSPMSLLSNTTHRQNGTQSRNDPDILDWPTEHPSMPYTTGDLQKAPENETVHDVGFRSKPPTAHRRLFRHFTVLANGRIRPCPSLVLDPSIDNLI